MLKRIVPASIVLMLVVCGAAFAAAQLTGTKVTLHSTATKGKVLATSTGRTLYLYTHDGKNKSNCTGSCAQTWPPLMTAAKPVAGMGVHQALLGTTRRSNGKLQVTYNGHPLYKFVGDSGAGQTHGEGYGGSWFVVTAAGTKK
jgi:predicted lipoprotein with Yx(FWY)xxD motif